MNTQDKVKFNLQFFSESLNKDSLNDDPEKPKDTDLDSDEETKTYTEEEFNKRLHDELSRRMKQKEKEKQEAVEEAAKLAKMNKDQKAEYEREKLESELKQLRAEKAMNEMRSEARVMFKDKDIDVSDELLDIVVSDSAETTKNNVDNLTKILDEMVQKKVQETLRQNSPKSFSKSGLSRDEILAIKDDSERQSAIAQNMHLFN
ncbi:head scaffolding protein [Staphylococcus phage SP276]|uniref:Phage capsid and scaffold n=2 Tax=root TaxID=1 RepID=A0A494WJG8_9CAUD|nr:head scaffolding protein [Staphylococcus phage SP276]BBJ34138.1 phage capsid and scaffold [Staphylococcus phage SP276]